MKIKKYSKILLNRMAEDTGRAVAIIEKDYYVTMLLRLLSKKAF